jgi:uncharacterized membrane protein
MRFTHRDAAIAATLTALCLAGNYASISLLNFKLMDVIVFIAGLCFGVPVGMTVGALCWVIYGTLNPYGFALPVWIATIVGESIYGLAGGLIGRATLRGGGGKALPGRAEMALWAALLTLVYDFFTNIVFAYTFGVPLIAAIATGWLIPPWFGVIHMVSNIILFSVGAAPVARAVMSLRGTQVQSTTVTQGIRG